MQKSPGEPREGSSKLIGEGAQRKKLVKGVGTKANKPQK